MKELRREAERVKARMKICKAVGYDKILMEHIFEKLKFYDIHT